jgi:methylmalonyl-CoA mutase cobalamin-binding subunit
MSPGDALRDMFERLNAPAKIQVALKALELLQEQESVAVICSWCEDHPIAASSLVQELAENEGPQWPVSDGASVTDGEVAAYARGFAAGSEKQYREGEPPTEDLDATN